MKLFAVFMAGTILGSTVAVRATFLEAVAPWYSQVIDDCGVKVARGVKDGTMTGFIIEGHRYGVCLNGDGNLKMDRFMVDTGEVGILVRDF